MSSSSPSRPVKTVSSRLSGAGKLAVPKKAGGLAGMKLKKEKKPEVKKLSMDGDKDPFAGLDDGWDDF